MQSIGARMNTKINAAINYGKQTVYNNGNI
jgi:hypothetical protein